MFDFASKKWLRLSWAVVAFTFAAFLYAFSGYCLAPYLVQTQLWPSLSASLGGQFHATQTKLDPFALTLDLFGFSLKAPDGAEVASIGEFHVNIDVWASLRSRSLVADTQIIQPSINIAYDPQGKPNYGFLLSKSDKPEEPSDAGVFPFLLTRLAISRGRLAFADQSRGEGYQKLLEPLDFTLLNFGTVSTAPASFQLSAGEDGIPLMSSDGDLHLENSSVAGELQLQDIQIPPLAAWLAAGQGFTVTDGTLSVKFNYRYDKDTNFAIPTLEATIQNLKLSKDNQPWLAFNTITTQGLSYQLADNQVKMQSLLAQQIALSGPAAARLDSVNLQGLLFDGKTMQAKLDAVVLDKASVAAPAQANIAQINAQHLGFDVKAKQLALDQLTVDGVEAKAPVSGHVGKLELAGIGFDTKAQQLHIKALTVDKTGLQTPLPATAGPLNLQGFGFDLKNQQAKLDTFSVDGVAVQGQFPAGVGKITLAGLGYDLPSQQLQLKSLAVDKLDLQQLAVPADVDAKPLPLGVGAVTVGNLAVSLAEKSLHCGQIHTQDAVLAAWLDRTGKLGFPGMDPIAKAEVQEARQAVKTVVRAGPAPAPKELAPSAPPASPSPPEQAWRVSVDGLELLRNDLHLRDLSHQPPVALQLSALNLRVKDFNIAQGKPFSFAVETVVNGRGRINADGKGTLNPLLASLKLHVSGLPLPTFQAYLDQAVRFRLVDGALGLNADIDYEASQPPKLHLAGDMELANLVTDDKAEGKDFINIKNLRFNDVIVENTPPRVSIKEVVVAEPFVRAVLDANKKFNIAENLSPPAGKPAAPASPAGQDKTTPQASQPDTAEKTKPATGKGGGAASAPPAKAAKGTKPSKQPANKTEPAAPEAKMAKAEPAVNVAIGTVRLRKAAVNFTDRTIQPSAFWVNMHDLNGDIRSLTSRVDSKSDVMLDGKLYEGAPVKIYGKINLFSVKIFTDIVMDFKDVNMTAFSPYAGKFAGYQIEKGKLNMDLHYKLENGQLTADNQFRLDNLTLGEKVDSPEATSMPVSLAISLLKDANGQINLDLPISGDLNNPQVNIWGLVGGAVKILLTKLVTAPLNIIGGLVNGNSKEDLGAVKFQPGSAELGNQERTQLADIAKGLQSRPALSLEIKGAAHEVLDRPGLAEKGLVRQLKKTRLIELGKSTEQDSAADQLALGEQEYARLLTNLFRLKNPGSPLLAGLKSNEALGGETLQTAKTQLLEQWAVNDWEFRGLAKTRSKSIREYLTGKLGFPEQRIYLLEVKILGKDEPDVKSLLSLSGS